MECETQAVKSFKKCGIGNALDGTKNDVLFQENVSSTVTLGMMIVVIETKILAGSPNSGNFIL
jgi:hypothetical protein